MSLFGHSGWYFWDLKNHIFWGGQATLMLNLLTSVIFVFTKISNSINIYAHHVKKHPLKDVGGSYIFVKESDSCAPPAIEILYIVKQHNTFITIKY